MWWVGLLQLPGTHPDVLSSPSLAEQGRKYDEKAHSLDKGRDISYQLPPQAKQTQPDLGKISLFPSNIELDAEKQRKKLEHLPPTLCFSQAQILLYILSSSPSFFYVYRLSSVPLEFKRCSYWNIKMLLD